MHDSPPTPGTQSTATEATSTADRRNRFARWLLLVLFAAAMVAAQLRAEPLQSANDRSRWATVRSLLESGSYVIDDVIQDRHWDTIDKVRFQDHFYSTKPPLLPTLIAGVTWCAERATGRTFASNPQQTTQIVLMLVNALPLILAGGLLARLAEQYSSDHRAPLFLLAVFAAGSFLPIYSLVLNNHTTAACGLVFALVPLIRILRNESPTAMTFAATGFWAAWTCTNELPAALFGVACFGLLLRSDARRTWLAFVPAALIPLIAFFVTNYLVTGGWKPLYMYYGKEPYLYVHEGIPSYWLDPQGVDRNLDPPLVYAFHCLVGHHGVLSLTPVFLLTIWGWIVGFRSTDAPLRVVHRLGCVLTIVVFGFYLTRTGNYNYGGVSVWLRWLLWLVPFWVLAILPVWNRHATKFWFRVTACSLLAISTASAWYHVPNPWQQPWLFSMMEQQGWINYEKQPPAFARPIWTWFQSLPVEQAWIEFAGVGLEGDAIHVRLETPGRNPDEETQQLILERTIGTDSPQRWESTIHRAAFAAGQPPEDFLIWPSDLPREAQSLAVTQLLGLPTPRSYNPGKIR